MKILIAPSILSFSPSDYRAPVQEIAAAEADWLHFDVMDGQFVPPITFGAGLVADLRGHVGIPFEAHLMTLTPEAHFDAFVSAGADRIIFHAEATNHAHRHLQHLRERGIQCGLAVNPGTDIAPVLEVAGLLDVALVMTVNPGWGGQTMIESCLEKVRTLRRAYPDLEIEVDGGVDPATIEQMAEAGATTFVTGSYLARAPSIAQGIKELRHACLLV